MKTIALKLPDELLEESGRYADRLRISGTERLAEVSRRVRDESMRVNAEFAAIEPDPDA